ncbi:hypothetical protein LCGC14_0693820 [marine sediment metagenome]|uniref:Uncharacterized protein n=1 Tax=marine sediment metagenome TaxID=412755 RepID=A0A0F9T618_9ZZZZ
MNEGERLLQKVERAADKGYLGDSALELELEIQASIVFELGRIASVLEREFGRPLTPAISQDNIKEEVLTVCDHFDTPNLSCPCSCSKCAGRADHNG